MNNINIDKKAEDISTYIALELKLVRIRKGITLTKVCDDLQMSPSYLSQIENKKRNKISIHTLLRLALYYDVNFSVVVQNAIENYEENNSQT